MRARPDSSGIIHGSTVAFGPAAVLILGPSGSGKSGLALDLISRGAGLVADDRTRLYRRDDLVMASAPASIAGAIEARGIGLLAVRSQADTPLRLVVDLGREAGARLPEPQTVDLLGIEIDLIHAGGLRNLAAAIHILATGGRVLR